MAPPLVSLEAQNGEGLVRGESRQVVETPLRLVRAQRRDVPGLGLGQFRLRTAETSAVGLRVAEFPTVVVLDSRLDECFTQRSLAEPTLARDRRQPNVYQSGDAPVNQSLDEVPDLLAFVPDSDSGVTSTRWVHPPHGDTLSRVSR